MPGDFTSVGPLSSPPSLPSASASFYSSASSFHHLFPLPLPPEPPFLCGKPFFPASEDGRLLYPLSNLHAEVTPCGPARDEKKGKVMWEEASGELPFNSTHLRSSLKRGPLSLPFVSSSSISLKELSSPIKETSRKRKEVVHRRARRHLAGARSLNQDRSRVRRSHLHVFAH